jgi:2-amino-4-hydroxy-6-hydroxymethyldihydropteridine diphosphokinase
MARTAVIALGSNLDDREGLVRAALGRLGRLGRVQAVSSLYETSPVGPDQPEYLNAVALMSTELAPAALLDGLLGIEASLGRVRDVRWGPRRIDLDLIAMDDLTVDTPDLTLPHPEAHRRAFVLAPLAEVAPGFVLVGYGPAAKMLESLDTDLRSGVRRLKL